VSTGQVSTEVEQEPMLWLGVDAQLTASTQISHRLYPDDDRVTVTVEGSDAAHVTLYLPRPELLRLRDTLTAMARELAGAQAAPSPAAGTPAE
jgi:hypothetical protein